MRIVIIEDETAAAQNLSAILHKVCPDIEVVNTIDTVTDSVEFFSSAPSLDLVFMDIHLADGSSFRIFDSVDITTPIIFTAYDQYAIEAFKVNSIDYLLKPINEESVRRAIEKWQRLTSIERTDYTSRVNDVAQKQKAQSQQVFLVHFRDKIIPLQIDDIAFFHTSEERVTAYCFDGSKYQVDMTLETLQSKLPSEMFFRANRQFIISRKSVKDISVWFGSRLAVNLTIESPERLIVPKARVHEFKGWLIQNN